MRFTIKTEALNIDVQAGAGRVYVNGAPLLPHEAAMLADVLGQAAASAELIAASVKNQPVIAEAA